MMSWRELKSLWKLVQMTTEMEGLIDLACSGRTGLAGLLNSEDGADGMQENGAGGMLGWWTAVTVV